jgi:co-chaperonin GroES (HSP10)
VYLIIPYTDLIARKRDELYPSNGYALVEKVIEETRVSGLILETCDFHNKQLGIVRYVGKPNLSYSDKNVKDADVEVGDKVVFEGNFFNSLEYKTFAKEDVNLGFIQLCWVQGKL